MWLAPGHRVYSDTDCIVCLRLSPHAHPSAAWMQHSTCHRDIQVAPPSSTLTIGMGSASQQAAGTSSSPRSRPTPQVWKSARGHREPVCECTKEGASITWYASSSTACRQRARTARMMHATVPSDKTWAQPMLPQETTLLAAHMHTHTRTYTQLITVTRTATHKPPPLHFHAPDHAQLSTASTCRMDGAGCISMPSPSSA